MQLTGVEMTKMHLPTTIMSPWSDTVWNDGASAETSHRYRPVDDRLTRSNTTTLSVELWSCKIYGISFDRWSWEWSGCLRRPIPREEQTPEPVACLWERSGRIHCRLCTISQSITPRHLGRSGIQGGRCCLARCDSVSALRSVGDTRWVLQERKGNCHSGDFNHFNWEWWEREKESEREIFYYHSEF